MRKKKERKLFILGRRKKNPKPLRFIDDRYEPRIGDILLFQKGRKEGEYSIWYFREIGSDDYRSVPLCNHYAVNCSTHRITKESFDGMAMIIATAAIAIFDEDFMSSALCVQFKMEIPY